MTRVRARVITRLKEMCPGMFSLVTFHTELLLFLQMLQTMHYTLSNIKRHLAVFTGYTENSPKNQYTLKDSFSLSLPFLGACQRRQI